MSVGSYPDMTLGKKGKHKNNDLTKQKKEHKKSSSVPTRLSGIQEINKRITCLIQKGTLFEHWLDDLYCWRH
jgi:hypothetical protein